MPVDAFIYLDTVRSVAESDSFGHSDRFQAERDRVQAALSSLDGLRAMVDELREQLQHTSPAEQPGVLRMIRQIRAEEIPPAEAELDAARQALAVCRFALSGRILTPAFHSL
jgi:hypothetical protein